MTQDKALVGVQKRGLGQLTETKNIEGLLASADGSNFKRSLNALDLVVVGVGAVIGSGIFVLPGEAAALHAGPAVIVAFVIAGFVASIAALCYAELAAIVPVAGSSYTYTYATMGEFAAWLVAWCVLLNVLVAAAVVATGWSSYLMHLIESLMGVQFSPLFTVGPLDNDFNATGGLVNLPAVLIILAVMCLLIGGTKKSTVVTSAIVGIKLVVIVVVVGALFTTIDMSNFEPFIPENTGTFGEFGVSGIFAAASMVFMAFSGFDMVSTTAQECKNPGRDLPIGIVGSLVLCTTLYMVVCFVMIGSVPFMALRGNEHPISFVVEYVGFHWLAIVVDLGAIIGLLSVIITMLLGAPRIFFVMAQDGLVPNVLNKIHPKFQTPYIATILCSIISALCAAFFPLKPLVDMTNFGTLYAFASTCVATMILRRQRPDLPRKFKVPGGPYLLPILGAVLSVSLIAANGWQALLRYACWLAIGTAVYFAYGYRHSKLNPKNYDVENTESLITPKIEMVQF